MSASSTPARTPSKNASSEALSFEKVIQADMPSFTAKVQLDKGPPSFLLHQVHAYSLKSGFKHIVVFDQSDCMLFSFERPEASANEHSSDSNAFDHLQINFIKNKEDLFPALVGFLEGARQTQTTQVTPAPSKL